MFQTRCWTPFVHSVCRTVCGWEWVSIRRTVIGRPRGWRDSSSSRATRGDRLSDVRKQVGVTGQLLDVDAVLLSVGQASSNKRLKGKFLEEAWRDNLGTPRGNPGGSVAAARAQSKSLLKRRGLGPCLETTRRTQKRRARCSAALWPLTPSPAQVPEPFPRGNAAWPLQISVPRAQRPKEKSLPALAGMHGHSLTSWFCVWSHGNFLRKWKLQWQTISTWRRCADTNTAACHMLAGALGVSYSPSKSR